MYSNDPTTAKKDAFNRTRRRVQLKFREMKDTWPCQKADEIQAHADRRDLKKFYNAFKAICGQIN